MLKKDVEVKNIVYNETRQYLTETNRKTGETKNTFFRIKERKEKVIFSDNATIVILDDGSKGVAKCNPKDIPNKTKGIKIAYLRAKINSLQKELDVLVS